MALDRMVEDNIITYPRQEFLLEVVNVAELKGLEIGALNEPLVKKIHASGRNILLGSSSNR